MDSTDKKRMIDEMIEKLILIDPKKWKKLIPSGNYREYFFIKIEEIEIRLYPGCPRSDPSFSINGERIGSAVEMDNRMYQLWTKCEYYFNEESDKQKQLNFLETYNIIINL